jgi:hypothetical protein
MCYDCLSVGYVYQVSKLCSYVNVSQFLHIFVTLVQWVLFWILQISFTEYILKTTYDGLLWGL